MGNTSSTRAAPRRRGFGEMISTCFDVVDRSARFFGTAERLMPSLLTMSKHAGYLLGFSTFLAGVGVVTQGAGVLTQYLQTRQMIAEVRGIHEELVAGTGLSADQFASRVYEYIKMKTKQTSGHKRKHLYFVYHPDTDWHPRFAALTADEELADSFMGLCEDLDFLCLWMQYLRVRFKFSSEWGSRPIFHLLMPAYRPQVIEEPITFAQSLQPLHIHGLIHNKFPWVALNLFDADLEKLDGIRIWRPDKSWWERISGSQSDQHPRILGLTQQELDEIFENEINIRRVRRRRGGRGIPRRFRQFA
ncbi:uncharacterized protein A1O5_13290 [Cladophialophora psammophila CBS 110553]|uniref:Uncharacterized protein n=1 Tax=Cladophialophora psammophila CBS 110553 TaxID=1182543 RepID=W9W4K2_9EURO|nr:uncharacterized protein A1O5_13290 [Cladophialophora psammophila CBS 110553]EXJ53514.1 hypothetical protein A1O5_13290 [Cladophialophora psammophila CBS 110553]